MTRQEEIREGLKEILSKDLIELSCTHENPPPYKDCGEECNEYIDGLILRLLTYLDSQGVVIKVGESRLPKVGGRVLPSYEAWIESNGQIFVAVEPLIEGE